MLYLFVFIKEQYLIIIIIFVPNSAFTKPWKVKGQDFELKLVDTAGQDEYAIFPAQHSMDMHGYVLVYSITSVQSFELLQVLLEKIMDMTGKIT
jgi:Ras family protein